MNNFSEHALKRMKERSITKEEVIAIIDKFVDVIVIPSDKDGLAALYFGKVGYKYLLIVVNKKTHIVITVRAMRRKEKTLYDKGVSA